LASSVADSIPQLSVELPAFKGTPGWEFAPIEKLDLAAFPVAEAGTDGYAYKESLKDLKNKL